MVNAWKIIAIIFIILFLALSCSLIFQGAKDYSKHSDCYNYGQDNVKICAIKCWENNYINSTLKGSSGEIPECLCSGAFK